ncbi:MAG: LapA family protein, partial [Chloroflexota bacterium]
YVELLVAFLIGLASGTILGWFVHVLAKMRTREDRRIAHQINALDKSLEVLNARVDYVIAVNLRSPGWRELHKKYLDLYRVYPYADPTHLADAAVLDAYFTVAETAGERDKAWAKEVDKHRYLVIASLKEKRADLVR